MREQLQAAGQAVYPLTLTGLWGSAATRQRPTKASPLLSAKTASPKPSPDTSRKIKQGINPRASGGPLAEAEGVGEVRRAGQGPLLGEHEGDGTMSRYNELDVQGPPVPDFYDEDRHADSHQVAAMADWAPLEALAEPDPREEWGTLGRGDRGGRGQQTEALVGVVERVSWSGGGLQLVGQPGWLDVSRWADPPVDLSGLQPGDEVTLEVQTSLPSSSRSVQHAISSSGVHSRRIRSPGRRRARGRRRRPGHPGTHPTGRRLRRLNGCRAQAGPGVLCGW